MLFATKPKMVTADQALPGRDQRMGVPEQHFVNGAPLDDAFDGMQIIQLGMGCFWGAERKFWEADGVVSTAVGYAGGFTQNPTYDEVCSGRTGHTEIVRVVFDAERTTYAAMLQLFWESHDPSQGMRQGNDVGTQYRSALFCDEGRLQQARASRDAYQLKLQEAGFGDITTEIAVAPTFYFAEGDHQQYLAKNPSGYCGIGGTGVSCPGGLLD